MAERIPDISELGLTVLIPPAGVRFHPTGKSVFAGMSDTSPERIAEVWRGHPQWGFQRHTPCTQGPDPDRPNESDPAEVSSKGHRS